jgi:hypothetical protein
MKYLLVAFTCALCLTANAQSLEDEIQIIHGLYGMEKQKAVEQAMNLSTAEAGVFWPLYDRYESERKKLGADRLTIIADYAANYVGLTGQKADDLAQRIFKNDIAFDKLHRKYFKTVKKQIGSLKAAQFMQIESYLQNNVRVAIANQLPFIGEIKK